MCFLLQEIHLRGCLRLQRGCLRLQMQHNLPRKNLSKKSLVEYDPIFKQTPTHIHNFQVMTYVECKWPLNSIKRCSYDGNHKNKLLFTLWLYQFFSVLDTFFERCSVYNIKDLASPLNKNPGIWLVELVMQMKYEWSKFKWTVPTLLKEWRDICLNYKGIWTFNWETRIHWGWTKRKA